MFAALLPTDFPPAFAVLLIVVSFMTSATTAALGIGGGLILLSVMASGMPVAALIPVHGAIQLGSNTGRAALLARDIDWRFVGLLAIGTVIGAAIGGYFVVTLPDRVLKLMIAAFVLWSVWGRKPQLGLSSPAVLIPAGVVAAILSMFIGASGPLVAALMTNQGFSRHTTVATHAASMVLHHVLKIIVFGLLGFAFAPWLPLIAAMIFTGFLGTYLGVRLLKGLSEHGFRLAFRLILTVLAANLIWNVLSGYYAEFQ